MPNWLMVNMLTMAYRMVVLLLHKPFSFSKSNYNALLLFRVFFFYNNNLNFIRIKLTLIFYEIICASSCSSLSIFIFVSFVERIFCFYCYCDGILIRIHNRQLFCRQTILERFRYIKFIAAINLLPYH